MKLLIQYKNEPHMVTVFEDQKSIFHMMEHRFSDPEWLDRVSLLILVGDQGSIKVFKPEMTYKMTAGEPDIYTQTI